MSEAQPEEFYEEPEDLSNVHALQNRYTFWYRYDSGKGNTTVSNYNQSIKRIMNFQSVERFWNIYDHLKRAPDFKDVKAVEFHLFKDGINPFWEDPGNKNGGKWMLRLRKGIATRYWEDILLAIIGEQFDVGNEICGAVLSVRSLEDIISVWNKSADNLEAVNKIRDTIRRVVRLPDVIPMEYKRHMDSLTDKSSYRNPTMVFRGSTRPGGYNPGGRGQSGWKGNNRWSGNNNNNDDGRRDRNNDRGSGGGDHDYRDNRDGGGGGSGGGGGGGGGYNSNRGDRDQGGGWRRSRNDGEDGGGSGGQRYNRHDRNDGGGGGEHRQQRNDRDGGSGGGNYRDYNSNSNNNNNNNNRTERIDNRDNRTDRDHQRSQRSDPATTVAAAAPPSAAAAAPVAQERPPSNAYTAGGGSFASRVKGSNASDAPPTLTAPPPPRTEGSSSTGAGWHRVNNPFDKK